MRRASTLAGAAVLASLCTTAPAHAHGEFVDGSPGPGDAVAAGSTTVRMSFANIDAGSRVSLDFSVTGQDAQPVGAGLVLEDGETLCASTEPLQPGIYTLSYLLDSPDGAIEDGGYVFEVVPAADAEDELDLGACAGAELRPPMLPVASTAGSGSVAPLFAAGGAVTVAVLAAVLIALRRRQG